MSLFAWGPRLTALAAFLLFASLAPGGPYWLDSSELAAAGARLGSPHPTGFPLWCVLAQLASLIPIGEIAFRVHLLSALAGALAVLWTARLVLAVGRGPGGSVDAATGWGAITAGALLATSLLFLRQATVTEVYAPTVALIAAAALLVERVAGGEGAAPGLGLAVVCGLGLGTHASFAWVGPVVGVLLIVRLYRGARFPLAAPVLLAIVVGGLYAYLAVRSASGEVPGVDWGEPRTLGALVDHARAGSFRAAYADQMGFTGAAAARHGADLADSLGPFGVIAALAGAVVLWRRRRTWWTAALLTSVVALDLGYALWINPMGLVDGQDGTPLLWAAAVAAGVGVATLVRLTGRLGQVAGGAVAALCVLPAAAMSIPSALPARGSEAPRAWAEAALDQVGPGGAVVVHSDSLAAVLRLVTAVEGARPDVAVTIVPHGGRAPAVVALDDREVGWELGGPSPSPRGGRRVVAGAPLALLVADDAALADDLPAAARAAVALLGGHQDRVARRTLARALAELERLAAARRRSDDAAAGAAE